MGTTRVWPTAVGAIVRKATQRSSRQTNRPGSSPSMMRVKMLGTCQQYGSRVAESPGDDRWLTIPNVITVIRLLCLPLFLYLLFGRENRAAAASLLGILGATDWVDGYVARHFHQVSELGKILDPVADRLLFFVGITAIVVDGSCPLWF